jgi:hypothetical protein
MRPAFASSTNLSLSSPIYAGGHIELKMLDIHCPGRIANTLALCGNMTQLWR